MSRWNRILTAFNLSCINLNFLKSFLFRIENRRGELKNDYRNEARKKKILSLYQPKRKLGSGGAVVRLSRAHAMNTLVM